MLRISPHSTTGFPAFPAHPSDVPQYVPLLSQPQLRIPQEIHSGLLQIPLLSTIFFPDLLNAFTRKYPDIPVMLEEFGSVRACDLVQRDQLDLALVNMELFNIDKYNNAILFNSQLYYCVAQNHPFSGRPVIDMRQFENEKYCFSIPTLCKIIF